MNVSSNIGGNVTLDNTITSSAGPGNMGQRNTGHSIAGIIYVSKDLSYPMSVFIM